MGWTLSQSFDFQGQEVRYDVRGEGEPLVLVHGTPWSSFNWRHLIPRLAESWTVHYFDLLGYGQSEKRDDQDVSLGVQNEVLAGLLEHWELESPTIIGHDFGGATVLRSHLLNGCAYEKIVLVNAVALAPWGSPFFAHVNKHEEAFQGVPDYIHEAIVTAYVKGAIHTPMPEETLQGILRPWSGETSRKAFYRQIAQASQRYTDEVEPLYGDVQVPVLVAWGEEDEWIPIARGKELSQRIPGAQFVPIADAGHLAQEDAPDELFDIIQTFIS